MLFRIIPKDLIAKINESELIVFFKNGSIYQLKGADDPDALRGAGPVGVVFDEFAKVKYEAWEITEKILRANNGWAWFIGTPKGKNHLYTFYNRGQQENKEWKSWLLKASTSGIIDPEQLELSRQTSSQAHFNQEWECEFLEGEGSVFRGVREAATAHPHGPLTDHHYVIGCDVAKVQDYTVICVYDRTTNKQVYQDRFQKIEWPFQRKRIAAIAKHYNNGLIMLDATGVGDPIADDLMRAGLNVEPFKISEVSKKEIVEKLSIWIEHKRIGILNIEESINELENFNYEIGPTGKIRYGAPEGFHDDIVIAHSLAVWSLSPLYREQVEEPQSRIAQRYEELSEDLLNHDQREQDYEFQQWSEGEF